MPDPSQVVYSVGTQLGVFITQIGGIGIIWIVGIYLCFSRRDLPQTPRMLIAVSLGIHLFLLSATMVVSWIVMAIMNETGSSPGDFRWVVLVVSYVRAFLRMLAHGLMLYAIFGSFRRPPVWDPVAMETPEE